MLTDTNKAVQGQRQSWNLIKKLGEGDAGEVFLVESVLEKQTAIIKRPRKGAFFTDILRQANQIKTEGSILRGLARIGWQNQDLTLRIPALIDQNRSEFDVGEQTFIVIEQAHGLDLKRLSQVIRYGTASIEALPTDPETTYLVQQWSKLSEFPAPLLVRFLLSVLKLLETIHTTEIHTPQGRQSGVIWNDVKPDHVYWDALHMSLMVIDWGNSQFLGDDHVTSDRQYSAQDDFRQFIQEMGSFVAEANPDLYTRLDWPESSANGDGNVEAIEQLKTGLATSFGEDSGQLQALRKQEAELYGMTRPELEHISRYEDAQKQLAEYGEIPENSGASSFIFKAAFQMAAEYRLEELQQTCLAAAKMPAADPEKWLLVSEIAGIALQTQDVDDADRNAFSNALTAGVAGDWPAALWELFAYLGERPRPEWWEKLSQQVRKAYLGLEPDAISPYTLFARLYYTLRSEVTRLGSARLSAGTPEAQKNSQPAENFNWQASEELIATVREEIIETWKESAPNPPNSMIGYSAADSLLEPIETLLPGWRENLARALAQPKAQVDRVMNAWEQKDFELARRGLRSILVWDPERARLYTAAKAIASAPQWLARVHRGASKDEPFYDFLTSVELAGRTLRNQVGPARWLDETLEAFKRLRKGTRSVDLTIEYPEVMREMPWLSEYQSREILSLPHTRTLSLERDPAASAPLSYEEGVVEGKFGRNQDMALGEALDTWIPEARGSSARVFAGKLLNRAKQTHYLAFKIMRPDQQEYALPLFVEEIQILTMLRDVPGVTPLIHLGFIKLDDEQVLPSDESHASAEGLSGQVIRYGAEQAQNFLASMDRQLSIGWLPYLALERRNAEYNLLRYCDASYTHGWFLGLRESLILALQLCGILQFAHDRNIVYRDHKILHYYWDPAVHGVTTIDWNIAKRHPQGLTEADRQFDLVQFGARALHHIFTGRSAQGSLQLGPNRPEDIEKASTHYPVSWTYDDERLPNQLRTILEETLNQEYTQVRTLRQDLLAIYQQLPSSDKS